MVDNHIVSYTAKGFSRYTVPYQSRDMEIDYTKNYVSF